MRSGSRDEYQKNKKHESWCSRLRLHLHLSESVFVIELPLSLSILSVVFPAVRNTNLPDTLSCGCVTESYIVPISCGWVQLPIIVLTLCSLSCCSSLVISSLYFSIWVCIVLFSDVLASRSALDCLSSRSSLSFFLLSRWASLLRTWMSWVSCSHSNRPSVFNFWIASPPSWNPVF